MRLRLSQEALNAYQMAIRLDDTQANAYMGSGQALWSRRDQEGAIKAFEAAALRAPNNRQAHFMKGNALRALGNERNETQFYEAALHAYERAGELEPGHAYTWVLRAEMLENLGRASEAREAYEQARRLGYMR